MKKIRLSAALLCCISLTLSITGCPDGGGGTDAGVDAGDGDGDMTDDGMDNDDADGADGDMTDGDMTDDGMDSDDADGADDVDGADDGMDNDDADGADDIAEDDLPPPDDVSDDVGDFFPDDVADDDIPYEDEDVGDFFPDDVADDDIPYEDEDDVDDEPTDDGYDDPVDDGYDDEPVDDYGDDDPDNSCEEACNHFAVVCQEDDINFESCIEECQQELTPAEIECVLSSDQCEEIGQCQDVDVSGECEEVCSHLSVICSEEDIDFDNCAQECTQELTSSEIECVLSTEQCEDIQQCQEPDGLDQQVCEEACQYIGEICDSDVEPECVENCMETGSQELVECVFQTEVCEDLELCEMDFPQEN